MRRRRKKKEKERSVYNETKTNLREWTSVDIGPFEHSSGKHDVGRLEILKSDFKTSEDAVDERIERLLHETTDRYLE